MKRYSPNHPSVRSWQGNYFTPYLQAPTPQRFRRLRKLLGGIR